MLYEWNDSLSVGYGPMDKQHRQFFAINAELSNELSKIGGANEKELLKIIADLLAYTRSHFSDEEQLMQQVGFPDFGRHKEAHDAFISIVRDLEAKVLNGELHTVASFLPPFVGDWLTRHIAVEDKQYASYLKTRSAVQAARNWL